MFQNILKHNVKLITKHPKMILAVAFLITIIAAALATQLELELNWVALAPKGNPAVEEYNRIIEQFPTLSNILVVVEGEDTVEMNKAVSDLEEKITALDEYVLSITTGLDQNFVIDYGLLLAPDSELEGMAAIVKNPNYEAFVATAEYLKSQKLLDEYMSYQYEEILNYAKNYDGNTDQLKGMIKGFYAGNPLMTDENQNMTLLMIQPSFDIMDLKNLEPGVEAIEKAVGEVNANYQNTKLEATGMHIVARDETASIESDSSFTTILAVALILAILYFAFKSYSAPILAFIPLILGIIWTVGLAQLVIGRLNMMTAFSAAMLLGLGIDYAIHMYSSYTERRANGIEKVVALEHAIEISGPGIITGALTTAVAFLALNASQLELLSELGTIMGLGIISTLISVFWVLPSLLMLKKEKHTKMASIKGHYKWIGKIASFVRKQRIAIIVVLVLSTVFMGYHATKAEFDLNLMNLEPAGLRSIELMNHLVDEYDMSADSFSIAVNNLEDVYQYQSAFEKVKGVKEVVSVASFLPKSEVQNQRLDLIEQIKALPYEMKYPYDASLLNGATESFVADFYEEMENISDEMLSVNTLTPDQLPENYKNQFVSKDGKEYLITVCPDFDIWSNLTSEKGRAFFDDLNEVSNKITGTPIFMKVLYDSASEELVFIGSLLVVILIIILMIHFRSIKYTLLALLPLVLTMIFTVGTMELIDLKFNMMNFLAILLIIGIGIDDGVHILHHYKTGVVKIEYLFASVGRAILLTTVTTICGFGSLIFSSYRGIASLGASLSIGVFYAFIMTLLILPLMLKSED
ncbi:MAG: MMPL family transporter [Clostridia bacterium]|nr:MMPL family transporter [Clostridia bacterium]